MPLDNIEELNIVSIHKAYQEKVYTAVDLVAAYLDRIKWLDHEENGPKLNALAAVNDGALGQAKHLDDYFTKENKFIGLLHGIPIVVKDHVMTRGLTTTFGSVIAKDFVPKEDATVVTKLREAGAIIIAKASLPDWGTDYFSTSSLLGSVRNPYDLERDAGGSSGGTAAAVAANMAVLGLGSDSAGSIRIPTSFCNLVGFRPTVGLISKHGTSPGVVGQSTLAPLGRSVQDVAIMMDALVGFDEKDPMTSIHARTSRTQASKNAEQLEEQSNVRVGVIRSIFGSADSEEGRALNSVIERALSSFKESGVTIVDVEIPNLEEYLEGTSLFLSRAKYDLEKFLKSDFGVDVAELVSSGRVPKQNVMLPFIAKNGSASPYENDKYGRQVDMREEFERVVLSEMYRNNVSALMFPPVKIPPPTYTDIEARTLRAYLPLNIGIASHLRWPSVCIPAGFTDSNLPIGLEIVCPPLKDQILLNIAYTFEKAVQGRRAPILNTPTSSEHIIEY